MSELKARKFFEAVPTSKEGFYQPGAFVDGYYKSEADKVIAELEERHKMEVEQLLMEIVGLKKLVETADKLLKQKGGFMIKDVTFNGVKLEGFKKEAK